MSRSLSASAAAAVAVTALVGAAAPAHAEKPSWADKPVVERVPVVASDPPTFPCGDRTIVFTGGDVVFQFQELPGERVLGLIKLRGAVATDGTQTYQARGGGVIRGTDDEGTFRLTITFVSTSGAVERVNSTLTFRDDRLTAVDRGTCSVDVF